MYYIRKLSRVNYSILVNIPIAFVKLLRMKPGETVKIERVKDSIVITSMVNKPQFIEKKKGHRDYPEPLPAGERS